MNQNQIITLPYQEIKVGERMRSDLGELKDLAKSIEEQGLIHPLTINSACELVDGGRRFAAITEHLKWDSIPCYVKDCSSPAHLRMMELEANVRRKEMTWKEKVRSVAEVHRLRKSEAVLAGDNWVQQQTGALLGISIGNVNYCLMMSKHLKDPNSPVQKAENLNDAIRILLQLKEDEAVKYESKFAKELMTSSGSIPLTTADGQPADVTLSIDQLIKSAQATGTSEAPPQVVRVEGKEQEGKPKMQVALSKYLHHGDCIEYMKSLEPECFDHIVTDPPFGIDMSNFNQGGKGMDVSRVEAEHQVEENLHLLTLLFPAAYRVLRDKGFMVVWYDEEHRQFVYDNAEGAGFTVCRWPLVWVKTHRCQNLAASYNFTKATEFAMVCRKGNATLTAPQAVNYWIGGNDEDKARFNHSFVKPEQLWRWIYTAIATKNQVVYDPFAGAGSAPLAAARAGYNPRASEKNANHYNKMVVEFKELMRAWYGNTHELIFV